MAAVSPMNTIFSHLHVYVYVYVYRAQRQRLTNVLTHTYSTPPSPHPQTHLEVDGCKLPAPSRVVEKLSEVEPVVVGAVVLGMVGGSESSQLVTVDRVVLEEKLHLFSDLHG